MWKCKTSLLSHKLKIQVQLSALNTVCFQIKRQFMMIKNKSCLGGYVKLGNSFGGSRGLVSLSIQVHSHCEDRLVDWTNLRCEPVLQARSVLVQTHHSVHAKIISHYRKRNGEAEAGREKYSVNTLL